MNVDEFLEKYKKETYLGDGLYASFDGINIILRAPRENGDHIVALDPEVFDALHRYKIQVYIDAKNIER